MKIDDNANSSWENNNDDMRKSDALIKKIIFSISTYYVNGIHPFLLLETHIQPFFSQVSLEFPLQSVNGRPNWTPPVTLANSASDTLCLC